MHKFDKIKVKYLRGWHTKVDKFKDNIEKWHVEKEYYFNGTRIYNELLKLV